MVFILPDNFNLKQLGKAEDSFYSGLFLGIIGLSVEDEVDVLRNEVEQYKQEF